VRIWHTVEDLMDKASPAGWVIQIMTPGHAGAAPTFRYFNAAIARRLLSRRPQSMWQSRVRRTSLPSGHYPRRK